MRDKNTERKEGEQAREKETNEYEGSITYHGDSDPEPRLYIILTPYQVYITPRRTGASSPNNAVAPLSRDVRPLGN